MTRRVILVLDRVRLGYYDHDFIYKKPNSYDIIQKYSFDLVHVYLTTDCQSEKVLWIKKKLDDLLFQQTYIILRTNEF